MQFLKRLFGPALDWRSSRPHLLLLTKFLRVQDIGYVRDRDYWDKVLGENRERAVRRFLEDGALAKAGLEEKIASAFKVPDLKAKLREKGLKVSGHKTDLIARLVEAYPDEMMNAVRNIELLQCSEEGKILAERFLADEAQERTLIEQRVFELIEDRQYTQACQEVAAYKSTQIFQWEEDVDWTNYDPSSDVEMLEGIFTVRPKILASLTDVQLSQLRVASAMSHLWGYYFEDQWVPSDFDTGLVMTNDAAAQMFIFAVNHQQNMAWYRQADVKTVEIVGADDDLACQECRKLQSNKYSLDLVPELPYEHCTSEVGCRCIIVIGDLDEC